MSTVQEIESAIRALPAADRFKLLADLPALFPEMSGDLAWQRIINDPRPRPALTALLDEVDEKLKRDPNVFPEIEESDFEVNA